MNGILIIAVGLVSTVLGHDLRSSNKFKSEINHDESEERIVGGAKAADHSRPWMVYVYNYKEAKTKVCGGALIKPNWVLTAAHCVETGTSYTLVAGTNQVCEVIGTETHTYFGTTAQLRNASAVHLKGWQKSTLKNDIALVKVITPFTTNSYVKTIGLPRRKYSAGTNLEVSGWGLTSKGSARQCYLNTVQVPVVSKADCKKSFPNLYDSQICTGYSDGKKGTCDGDSGSPLVQLNGDSSVLVGIVSHGKESCKSYSVHTQVYSYDTWIKQTIGS